MKLEKAIELLNFAVSNNKLKRGARSIEALRLGVEALKRIEADRALHLYPAYKLLPGETEGDENAT